MAVAYVNGASNATLGATSLNVTISTTADNDIVVVVAISSTSVTVSSVTDTGGSTYQLRAALTGSSTRLEIWSARNAVASSSVTVNLSASARFAVCVAQYSGATGLGASGTNSSTSTNPTIALSTQDNNNFVIAGFGTADTKNAMSANTGNLRVATTVGTAPSTALNDNTSATPSSVTNTVTLISTAWVAAALELRALVPAIIEPTSTRPIAVRTRQPLRLEANTPTNWFQRTNGGSWAQIGTATAVLVWETPSSVTRRFTFDDLQIAIGASSSSIDDTLDLNLCEGPVAVLLVTGYIRNEALEGPPLRPDEMDHDDPPLGVPLAMPPANRDRFGTTLLEGAGEQGGAANLTSVYGPGIFVETSGKLGSRTPVARVRGLGPYPALASYHHSEFYFNYDFGRSRTLGLTRVLFEDAAGNVAIVRGDGRRNTYRAAGGGSYTASASLQNTLAKPANFKETTPSGLEYHYNATAGGRASLDRIIDRYGNPVYYAYDVNSRLQKVQGLSSTAGLLPYLAYDGSGLCSMAVLEDGAAPSENRSTYFHYDGNRNLSKIIGPELCITYFEYNTPEQLSAITDPEGFRWYFAYDADGRAERAVDPLGNSGYFAYDTAASLTKEKDRAGKQTYFQYNAFGSPTRVYNPGTPTDYFAFDGEANLTASKNRLGNQWTYEYDGRANRIAYTDPLTARSYFAYDSQDLLRKYVDPLNRTTYLDYGASRNRTKQVDPLNKSTYYEYQGTGLLHFMKDRQGNFTYFAFDGKANHRATVDALENKTYFDYNSAGERTKVFDARGNATYFAHDKRGRVTEVKDAYLITRLLAYDARCNLVTQVNERGKSTYHSYDGNSNRTKTVRKMDDGSFLATYFRYDPEERLEGKKDARLNETTWVYDSLGRREKQIAPAPLGYTTYFDYDVAHELTMHRDPLFSPTYFTYDTVGRQQKVKDAYLNETYMGYDIKGNAVLTLDQLSFPTYHLYDQLARRIKTTDAYANFDYFVFDAESNLTASRNRRGYTTYHGYDALNRTLETISPGQLRTYYEYDAVGSQIRTHKEQGWGRQPWGNSPWGGERVTTYFSFDKRNRRESMKGPFSTTGPASDMVMYYAYDATSNRVERRIESLAGGDRRSTYFEYDAVNRLVKRIDPSTDDVATRGFTVSEYDGAGNRTKRVDQEGRPTYLTFDEVNRESTRFNAFLDTTTMTYDARSAALRRIDAEGRTAYFEYDLLGRQIKQSNALGEVSYFGYDARSSTVLSVNPRGFPTYLTFDRLARTSHGRDALGGIRYFGFDEVGNQILGLDELNNPSYFTFDPLDRRNKAIGATGATTYMKFDGAGLLRQQLDADGRVTAFGYYGYDAARRPTRQTFSADPSIYFAYDTIGSLTRVDDETGASVSTYDKLNRLTKKVTLAGPVYYEYDKSGLKTRLKDPTLRDSYYRYDVASRLHHVQLLDGTQRAAYFEYDRGGLARKKTTPQNRVLTYYRYDNAARLNQLENKDSSLALISYFAYSRDANGMVIRTRRESAKHYYYSFDALDRLTDEIHTTSTGAVLYGWYYDYDAATNRKRKQETRVGDTVYYDYNSRNLITKEFKIPASGAQVTHYFTFDLSQRMTDECLAWVRVTVRWRRNRRQPDRPAGCCAR